MYAMRPHAPTPSWLGLRDAAIPAAIQPILLRTTPGIVRILLNRHDVPGSSRHGKEGLDCGLSEIVIGFQGMNDQGFTD